MYNKITIIGHSTKDFELRYTPAGTAIGEFTIAANHSYGKGEDRKQEVLFLNCVVFGRLAESISKYVEKGSLLFAEGRLQEQKWESDGQQRRKMVAILDTIRLLDKKVKETQEREVKAEPQEQDLEPF